MTSYPCEHWTDCGMRLGGCCSSPDGLNHHGRARVYFRECHACPHYEGPTRGAGDRVHDLATMIGLGKGCGGCQGRREALNDLLPAASVKA